MSNYLVRNVELLDKSMRNVLQAAALVSPLAGAFYGFAGGFGLAGILSGLWVAPAMALGVLGTYHLIATGGSDIVDMVKTVQAEGLIKGLLKPSKILDFAKKSLNTAYQSLITVLPGSIAAIATSIGAVLSAPGVLFAHATTAATVLSPVFLVPALIGGAALFVAGGAIGSRIAEKLAAHHVTPLFSPLQGASRGERLQSFLGRVLSYHKNGEAPLEKRHPVSFAAIALGTIGGGIAAAAFGWGILPAALIGSWVGGAMTLPLQDAAVDVAREKHRKVVPVETVSNGNKSAEGPQPFMKPKLADLFGYKTGVSPAETVKVPVSVAAAQPKQPAA